MIETRLIVDANNHLGEGPLWDVKEQRLYWIDSTAAEISSCRADGSDVRRYFVPRHIGSMALRERGGAVVALANGLHFYDFETQTVKLIADPESDDTETRFNDGKVDREGGLSRARWRMTSTVTTPIAVNVRAEAVLYTGLIRMAR
jgi:L-arabinonolactonase